MADTKQVNGLDPAEDATLTQILNTLFDGLKAMMAQTTPAQRETFRDGYLTQMKNLRKLIVRNIRTGIQGPDQE